jgi:general secretion pathway protein G
MKNIAIVVISAFAVLAEPPTGQARSTLTGATRSTVQDLEVALDTYAVDNGVLPTTEQGLAALITNMGASNWNGPYLKYGRIPLDPWGHPIRYRAAPEPPRIFSAGPDGVFGTPDDVDSSTYAAQTAQRSHATRLGATTPWGSLHQSVSLKPTVAGRVRAAVFVLEVYVTPTATIAGLQHGYHVLLLQVPIVGLICLLTFLILCRHGARPRTFGWTIPLACVSGIIATNIMFIRLVAFSTLIV